MKLTLFKNDIPDDFELEGDIAIDTETMGLNLSRDRLCLLQFSSGNGEAYMVQFENSDYSAPNLKKLLLDPSRQKIFHYARFDLLAIKKYLGLELESIFCTKIASRLVRTYTDYHGLKDLCREILSVTISKQQQSSYWGAEELSNEQMEYAAKDVLYLHSLRQVFLERLEIEGRLEAAKALFAGLKTRVQLDEMGFEEVDFFSY